MDLQTQSNSWVRDINPATNANPSLYPNPNPIAKEFENLMSVGMKTQSNSWVRDINPATNANPSLYPNPHC